MRYKLKFNGCLSVVCDCAQLRAEVASYIGIGIGSYIASYIAYCFLFNNCTTHNIINETFIFMVVATYALSSYIYTYSTQCLSGLQ